MAENFRKMPMDEVLQWIRKHRTMAQDGLDHVLRARAQSVEVLAQLDDSWREHCQEFTSKQLDAWEAFYRYHLNVVERIEAVHTNYVVADGE